MGMREDYEHSRLIGLLQRVPYVDCADTDRQYVANWLMNNGVTIAVRCKDCRWRKQGKLCYMISGCGEPVGTGDNFFCQYGERRTEK